jgi:predicted ATPase
MGELHTAREHCERCIELYDPARHRRLVFVHGDDPRVACLVFRAWCLWYQGYADQARQGILQAVEAARETEHPQMLGFGLSAAAMVYQMRREPLPALEQAEATIAACRELPYFLWHGVILRGWTLVQQGLSAEGIARMRDGLRAYVDMETRWVQPYYMALLAQAYGDTERIDEGLLLLNEALAVMDATKERAWEAELHRIKGELLLKPGAQYSQADAEACFHQAIEVARRQDAKAWELRATTSLSRLWQQQGKHDAARQQLDEVYHWFTEGLDTLDLQSAKVLLEALEVSQPIHKETV